MAAPPRLHPLARSAFARWLDGALAKSWSIPGNPAPRLEPDYLWRIGSQGFTAADECAGRTRAEVDDFRERLDRLCRSLRDEARLNALGHTMAYGQLKAAIRTRHRLGRLWRENPALIRTEIAPPIVVAGQMRAGTTRVHRLLVADPRHVGTRFCNSFNPVPPPGFDYRPMKSALALTLARRINPWLDVLHPFGSVRADEEIGWLSLALLPAAYEAQWHIPTYIAWSESRDPAPVYREFARILRTDAAVSGNAQRPRVLKCPQYAEDLATVLETFPDARMVKPQRKIEDILESAVSLVASQQAAQSDHADLDSIALEWKRKLALRQIRSDAALAGFAGPVAKVGFDELNSDWRAAIHSVYAQLDLGLNSDALAAMEREQARAGEQRHADHRAQLEAFAGP